MMKARHFINQNHSLLRSCSEGIMRHTPRRECVEGHRARDSAIRAVCSGAPSVPNLKFASYGVSSCLANFKFEKHTRINFF